MEKSEVDYINMQKNYYDMSDLPPDKIVGSYAYHEDFPYETQLLYINGDIRKPLFASLKERKAFDIACGEGRMIRRDEKNLRWRMRWCGHVTRDMLDILKTNLMR
jgi:hypothetical protein